jgi:hypothetical protein
VVQDPNNREEIEMFDDGGNDYGYNVLDDTEIDYTCGDDCDVQDDNAKTGEGGAMKTVKTIGLILAAAYTLISAALSIVKFINQLSKLKPVEA